MVSCARIAAAYASAALLDNRVRAVLSRLELEDAAERAQGLPSSERARAVVPTTGRFLFSLVAPQADCEVLEIGGSRGYSTIWLAAGVRYLRRPRALARARSAQDRRVAAEHRGGRARAVGRPRRGRRPRDARRGSTTSSTSSSSTRRRRTTSSCSSWRARKVEPAALLVADNVLSHPEALGALLGCAAGRPDARERHPAARPRPRAERRPALTCAFVARPPDPLLCRLPRKGGGPVVNSDSSTGSGGTSG